VKQQQQQQQQQKLQQQIKRKNPQNIIEHLFICHN